MKLLFIGIICVHIAESQEKTVEPEVQRPRKAKTGQETASESFDHNSEEDITYSNEQFTSNKLLTVLFPGEKILFMTNLKYLCVF